jgi:predicted nucleic acid-binding protein
MILADTSIWVDHIRSENSEILMLTQADQLVTHPYVIGELAMGNIQNRSTLIADMNDLVTLLPVRHAEVMSFIETRQLYGTGLQYVDVHLLASALATTDCVLWTRDKRLHAVAERLGVAANLA